MNFNQVRLPLDITGINLNNRILDEPHTLANRQVRAISPTYGPFFSESVVIREGARTLSRGTDYQIVELHQEATLLYGKEISSVILIINRNVGSNVTISYQALGGHFAFSNNSIANMYQSILNDNRPITWNNVLNKPVAFTPTIHRHLLDDVYGFEPVVDTLERIKRAITLGQTSVVLAILNNLLSDFKCKEPNRIVPTNKIMRHDAVLYLLSKRKLISNVSIDVVNCDNRKGRNIDFYIDTIGYPIGETLHWEFFNPNGNVSSISNVSGTVVSNNAIISLSTYVSTLETADDSFIYLGVKKNIDSPEYLAVSYKITLQDALTTNEFRMHTLGDFDNDFFYHHFPLTYTDPVAARQLVFYFEQSN